MSEPRWVPPTQPQLNAANKYIKLVLDTFAKRADATPESAISATAIMAGTFLFRSFNFSLKQDVAPGTVVLSEQANICGELLITTLCSGLNVLKVEIDQNKVDLYAKKYKQQMTVNQAQECLEKSMRAVSAKHNLTDEQAAHACALAAAALIEESAAHLDVHLGFYAAVFGFISGTKTAPIPLSQDPVDKPADSKKPWYKFW